MFKDDDVIFLRCNGILNHACLSFDARNVKISDNNLKNKICLNCIKKRNIFKNNSKFKSFNLDYFVSQNDLEKIKNTIYSYDHKYLIKFKFKGVAVGLFCLYEIILNGKKNDLNFNEDDYEYYKAKILNSCVIISALELLLLKYSIKSFYTYNPLYSHNRCAVEYLNNNGVLSFGLHAGNNFSVRLKKLSLFEGNQTKQELRILDYWDSYKDDISPNKEMVDLVFNHLCVMIYSKFWGQYGNSYSSQNIREFFKIPKSKKIYLATLSSSDERFAANTVGVNYFRDKAEIFKSQIEWVKFLIKYVKDNKKVHLIIRIHPRDYSNARYPGRSNNADLLSQLLSNLPSNISYNTPDDNISIFDLAHEVSLLLNYHSSSGREFALLGIPVLIHSKSVHTFTTDFCIVANSLKEYKNYLFNYENNHSALENIKCSLKWLCFEHCFNTLDLNVPKYFYENELKSASMLSKIIKVLKKLAPNLALYFELKFFKYLNKNNKFSEFLDPFTGQIMKIQSCNINNYDFLSHYIKLLKNSKFISQNKNSILSKNIMNL